MSNVPLRDVIFDIGNVLLFFDFQIFRPEDRGRLSLFRG